MALTAILQRIILGLPTVHTRALYASLAYDLNGDSGKQVNHGYLYFAQP